MASPKSGTAGSAVTPAGPDAATEADNADPGAVESASAAAAAKNASPFGPVQTKPFKPPTSADKDKKLTWIEIVLVDEDMNPVPGEAYSILLADGESVASGTLDDKGFARVDGIDPGTCQVTFPNLDKDAWKKL